MTSEYADLWSHVQEAEDEIRRLKVWKSEVAAGRLIRATSIIGVIPPSSGGSGTTGGTLGSVTIWENNDGADRDLGDVVVSGGNRLFETTNTPGDPLTIGVLTEDTADNTDGHVRHSGYQGTVNVTGAVVAGHYLRTSATPGLAEDTGSAVAAGPAPDGSFGYALTADALGVVAAYLFPTIHA